jgi:hypothetical protein
MRDIDEATNYLLSTIVPQFALWLDDNFDTVWNKPKLLTIHMHRRGLYLMVLQWINKWDARNKHAISGYCPTTL